MDNVYDVIIVGGGPAGLSAGLYASRARLNTLLIERGMLGGRISNAAHVENYPGFPEGISGFELSESMQRQAMKYGLETLAAEVVGIEVGEGKKVVKTTEGDYSTKTIIIAGGAELHRLGVPEEERLVGRGISYCATCDGPFFKEQAVAVVGGGDSAVEEGNLLTKFASKVILIHRRDKLRASNIVQELALSNEKMEFMWDTVVDELLGQDRLTGIRVHNVKTGETSTVEVSAVFVYVGQRPNTSYLKGLIFLDEEGRIPTDARMETEVRGIFAAGDIRKNSSRQVVTAAGDGATAALSAEKFVSER